MKWWKVAGIISIIWVILIIATGMIHTNIILKNTLTPQQDEAISEVYGMICVGGLPLIWLISFLVKKNKSS